MTRFKITNEENLTKELSAKVKNRIEQEARFDRAWFSQPETFDPHKHVMEEERLNRTISLIPPGTSKACDLGFGSGYLSDALIQKGYEVDSVDISKIAIDRYKGKAKTSQDYVPYTKLEDGTYSVVLATDLIAHLPESERRLLISECSRLITPNGRLIISTPLDVQSTDAAERFLSLIQTEFDVITLIPSHHRLWLFLHNFKLFRPFLNKSKKTLSILEAASRYFYENDALTHLIVLAQRRPLYIPPTNPPIERTPKKTVWE